MKVLRLVDDGCARGRGWLVVRVAAVGVLALALVGACGGSDDSGAPPADSPSADAAAPDALEPDAAPQDDAAEPDAVEPDAPGEDAPAADSAQPDAVAATLGSMSVQDLHDALATKDFLLINVHVPYQGEIAPTDAKISYLLPDTIAAFVGTNLDQKVVVYCMTNYMSTIAGKDLVSRGYTQVRYLDGGMSAWTQAGYPLENNP